MKLWRNHTVAVCVALISAHAVSAPTVTSIAPARNVRSAPVNSSIVVTFDVPVLPSSIDSTTFKVFGHWSGVPRGLFTLENGNTRVRFQPQRPFSAGELVTVSLSKGIRDQGGAGMTRGYAWTFWAQTGPGTFTWTETNRISTRRQGENAVVTYGAYGGDLNRDGLLDILTTNEVTNDVRVWLGNQTGGYDTVRVFPLPNGNTPSPNEGTDLNGDGNMDYVCANYGTNRIHILIGNGTGGFSSITPITVGTTPCHFGILDLEGDGDFDICVANLTSNNLSVLRNNGNGTFAAATSMEAGVGGERTCAAADFNNDGILDLAVGGYGSNEIAVLLADSTGGLTFSAKRSARGSPWMMAVGDVNGDGNVDVVSANSGANHSSVLFGDGLGGLDSARIYPVGGSAIAIDLGDIDGDGDLDMVTSSYSGGAWTAHENPGNGLFTNPHTFDAQNAASCATLHDRDNDGDLDMTGIDELADLIFLFRNGPPVFVAGSTNLPSSFEIEQNYPNPFNGVTTFHFRISVNGFTSLRIYDLLGRETAVLVNEKKVAGEHTVQWDASRQVGIPSGVYHYRLQTGSGSQTRKLILLK
ncbi:MAG: hypothetical protein HW407_1544 [Bacteroidetes bacterium]|nr:hypothetical protein [Bacteroidota bacterium]